MKSPRSIEPSKILPFGEAPIFESSPRRENAGSSENVAAPAESLRERFQRLTIIILVMYVLPIALLAAGVIPFAYRYPMLLLMTLAAVALSWRARHTRAARGMRLDNLRTALQLNGVFLLAAMLGLCAFSAVAPSRHLPNAPGRLFEIFYILVSCPAQEFLFRSFLWAELQNARCSSRLLEFAVLVIPYTLIHIIYQDALTLLLTFVAGAAWYWIYRRAPNWLGVTLGHAAAGAVMISFGII